MSRIDEIDAIMNSSEVLSSKPKNRIEEIDEIMSNSGNMSAPTEKEKEFSWPRFLGEKAAQGALNLADAPQRFVESFSQMFNNPHFQIEDMRRELDAELERRKANEQKGIENGPLKLAINKKQPEMAHKEPIVSGFIKPILEKSGIDLHSQGEGQTHGQRIAGHAAKFGGESLIPGGRVAGLAKNFATGAAIGGVSGALQEGTNLPPIAADLTALASALLVHLGAPKLAGLLKNSPSLTEAEKRVSGYIQNTLGEEASGAVAENIANRLQYPTTGYEPTTAEVSNNPLTSQLHRLRQGVPGSGLAEAAGAQNDAITGAATKLSLNKSSSSEIKDTVGEELAARKAKRHAETEPLYTALSKDQTQVVPVKLQSFLKENSRVKGKKKKDLDEIEKLIKPSGTKEGSVSLKGSKLSKDDILKLPEPTKSQLLVELEKSGNPQGVGTSVAELDEVRQAINDKVGELKKSGQNNRARQLIEGRKALDKDLEASKLQQEATTKYAELSKPVNEILEHPTISKIPESRLNDIFPRLFNTESYDNIVSLKKVLKDRPKEWEAFQDASVDHMMKSIRNAGAEGKGNTLSYAKFNKFLEKHKKALKEVFTPEQIQLLGEIGSGLTGRNIAETLGLEKTSATYGKLVAGTHLGEGLSSKLLKGASYAAHPIPKLGRAIGEGIRTKIENYSASKEADVMAVLDKVLKDPEYAHKLITHKFKNQAEFNKGMNLIYKQLPSVLIDSESKED